MKLKAQLAKAQKIAGINMVRVPLPPVLAPFLPLTCSTAPQWEISGDTASWALVKASRAGMGLA